MLKLEQRKSVPGEEWRQLLAALESSPLHLPEVLAVGVAPADLDYFVLRSGAEVVAAGLGITSTRRRLKLFKGARELYVPVFPALAKGDGLAAEVVAALVQHARLSGYRQLEIDPRSGQDLSGLPELASRQGHSLFEFTVDLSQDLEAILRGLHKKHRKNVREAEGHGLELAEDPSLEGFLALREMQESSSERAAERGNSYGVQKEEFFRATYEATYRNGPGRVLFARKDGVAVAALAFLTYGKKAVTVRSGSTPLGYQTSAMYLLQFELFRRLQQEGCLELNIGGVPVEAAEPTHPQHGLFTYKRYYGGKQCLRTGLIITL